MKEIWKDIKGYERLYQVSSFGNVRSLERKVNNAKGTKSIKKQMLRKLYKDRHGYYMIDLWKQNTRKKFLVSRLVAQAFIPNPHNKCDVNHKDEKPENNNLSNLGWMTRKENINYGTGIERRVAQQRKPVNQFDLSLNLLKTWSSAREADKQGFNQSSIGQCCKGKLKTHRKYIWKYV